MTLLLQLVSRVGLLLDLFISFVRIGCFSFGGGYAMLPLMSRDLVTNRQWLGAMEFKQLIVLSQITPGPIAVNAATYTGLRLLGIPGAIAATLGLCAVSFVLIVTLLRHLDTFKKSVHVVRAIKGIKGAVVVLLVYAAYGMGQGSFGSLKAWLFFGVAVFLRYFFNIPAGVLIVSAGVLGALWVG